MRAKIIPVQTRILRDRTIFTWGDTLWTMSNITMNTIANALYDSFEEEFDNLAIDCYLLFMLQSMGIEAYNDNDYLLKYRPSRRDFVMLYKFFVSNQIKQIVVNQNINSLPGMKVAIDYRPSSHGHPRLTEYLSQVLGDIWKANLSGEYPYGINIIGFGLRYRDGWATYQINAALVRASIGFSYTDYLVREIPLALKKIVAECAPGVRNFKNLGFGSFSLSYIQAQSLLDEFQKVYVEKGVAGLIQD